MTIALKGVYGAIATAASTYFTTTLTTNATAPKSFNFPSTPDIVKMFSSSKLIAAYFASSNEIQIYKYPEGKLEHTIKCPSGVSKMQLKRGKLFVQFDNDQQIMAWDLQNNAPIKLPDTWKRVTNLYFGRSFIAHSNLETEPNKTISLIISNSDTYEPIRTISTDYFKIFDIVEKSEKLFVTGIESNPCTNGVQNGFLMMYEHVASKDKKPEVYKKNFDVDSNNTYSKVLKIKQSFIYNSKWQSTNNCVWDANTMDTVLARETVQGKNTPALTAILGYTIVTADQKEIAIYRVDGELDRPFGGQGRLKELYFEIHGKTRELGKAHIIPCQKSDPVTSIHLFKFIQETVLAEGYTSGKVIIRNLDTLSKIMEFSPPGNMKTVCGIKTYYDSDKLLVHFGNASTDGTIAVMWDLTTQKPVLNITRDSKGNYDSTQDIVKIEYPGTIVVVSGNEVKSYADVVKNKTS